MYKFITGVILTLISIWGFTTVYADSFNLNGKDLYAVDQTNPEDVFLITDTLYTDNDMKLQFESGKRVGKKEREDEYSVALDTISNLEGEILRLKSISVDEFECILTKK